MFRRALFLLTFVAASTFSMSAFGATIVATTTLDGAQQVPANASAATGVGTWTIDDVTGEYSLILDVIGIDVFEIAASVAGGIHIHEAAAGSNGGIVLNVADDRDSLVVNGFEAFTFTASGIIADLPGILGALNDGNLYINVHTEEFTGGEIRGQFSVVPVPPALLLFGSAIMGMMHFGRRRGLAV